MFVHDTFILIYTTLYSIQNVLVYVNIKKIWNEKWTTLYRIYSLIKLM